MNSSKINPSRKSVLMNSPNIKPPSWHIQRSARHTTSSINHGDPSGRDLKSTALHTGHIYFSVHVTASMHICLYPSFEELFRVSTLGLVRRLFICLSLASNLHEHCL